MLAADMTAADHHDRELLSAVGRRHLQALPSRVHLALSRAVRELIDPLVLPELVPVGEDETRDPVGVIASVRGRLIDRATSTLSVPGGMARARAARQLTGALDLLDAAGGVVGVPVAGGPDDPGEPG